MNTESYAVMAILKATTSSNIEMGRFFILIIHQNFLPNLLKSSPSYLKKLHSMVLGVHAYQFLSIAVWMLKAC